MCTLCRTLGMKLAGIMVSRSSNRGSLETAVIVFSAILCGTLAGSLITFAFLWFYGFATYGSVFFSRSVPVLSSQSKYAFLAVASAACSIFFVVQLFRKAPDREEIDKRKQA
jgi:hypothetical protein